MRRSHSHSRDIVPLSTYGLEVSLLGSDDQGGLEKAGIGCRNWATSCRIEHSVRIKWDQKAVTFLIRRGVVGVCVRVVWSGLQTGALISRYSQDDGVV